MSIMAEVRLEIATASSPPTSEIWAPPVEVMLLAWPPVMFTAPEAGTTTPLGPTVPTTAPVGPTRVRTPPAAATPPGGVMMRRSIGRTPSSSTRIASSDMTPTSTQCMMSSLVNCSMPIQPAGSLIEMVGVSASRRLATST